MPVSYTHLDVYKRQRNTATIYIYHEGQAKKGDVYKRQKEIINNCESGAYKVKLVLYLMDFQPPLANASLALHQIMQKQ